MDATVNIGRTIARERRGRSITQEALARLARERLVVVVDHEGLFDDIADQVIELCSSDELGRT